MAKLCSYYKLCPLIDTKSLLGISNDVEKGMVIVTLGKNMAIKYRLLDQKQIYSWRTKEKFSSLILYSPKDSKYVAVFNHSVIKLWSDTDENLDKIKKYKCHMLIETLIPSEDNVYVLFKNGALHTLEDVIQHRKTLETEGVINEDHTIKDVLHLNTKNELYVGFLVQIASFQLLYWTACNQNTHKFSKIKLQRDGAHLVGYAFHQAEDAVSLLTIWNDGRIYLCPLETSDTEVLGPGELFTVLDNIATEKTVSIASLNESYIAIYGADTNEEGSILLIYNTQFKVTPSKQLHKLFTDDSKIWRIDNNLFLPIGQNLVVIPFCLESEQLAALVGSHKVIKEKIDADIEIVQEYEVGNWSHQKTKIKKVEEDSEQPFSNFLSRGLPESQVIEQVLPDILEKEDLALLKVILDFRDIPEKYLAKILKFLLSIKKDKFENRDKHPSENLPQELQPLERTKLLDEVLRRPFSEVLLLPHIHAELSVGDVLLLIKYICYLFSEAEHKFQNSSSIRTEEKLIAWGCLLVDGNYQKFLLSKDEEIPKVLNSFHGIVNDELEMLEKIEEAIPALHRLKYGITNSNSGINSRYNVEQLCLY